jgi:uncharacterized integral membrane protein (TIGR00697 family)
MLIISNVAATKLVGVGGFIFDGGALLFPFTYIFGDVLSEIFGYKKARFSILLSFGLQILASGLLLLVQILPADPSWGYQEAYESILGFFPRIVIASLLAYVCGQIMNALVLVKIKEKFGEKRMWVRLVGSTIVGELLDSLIFCFIARWGELSVPELFNYAVVGGFAYKTVVEILFLPLTYIVIKYIKKLVKEDKSFSDIPELLEK